MDRHLLLFSYLPLIIYFVITIIWCTDTDTKEGFLGGLDMDKKVFNWHPILMSLSFGFLFFSAISSLFNFNQGYRILNMDHKTKKYIHSILHTLSIICFSFGLAAVFKFHNDNHIKNLYSLHRYFNFINSWVGLAAVIMYCSLYIGGFVAFLTDFLSEELKKTVVAQHIIFG